MDGLVGGWMGGRIGGRMDGRTDWGADGRADGLVGGCVSKQKDRRNCGWTDRRVYRLDIQINKLADRQTDI